MIGIRRLRGFHRLFTGQRSLASGAGAAAGTMTLESRVERARDLAFMRFRKDPTVQCKMGHHISIPSRDGKLFRYYTPVYSDDTHIDLVVKHVAGGTVSPWLYSMDIGDSIPVNAGRGHFQFESMFTEDQLQYYHDQRPAVEIMDEECDWDQQIEQIIGVAGGCGITPVYAIIAETCKHNRWLLANPEAAKHLKPIHMDLMYMNKTPWDVAMAPELVKMAMNPDNNLHLHLCFDGDEMEIPKGYPIEQLNWVIDKVKEVDEGFDDWDSLQYEGRNTRFVSTADGACKAAPVSVAGISVREANLDSEYVDQVLDMAVLEEKYGMKSVALVCGSRTFNSKVSAVLKTHNCTDWDMVLY